MASKKKIAFNTAKIKGLIAENEITQAKLAKSVGITYQSLNEKLNGKREFKVNEIQAIANYFKKEIGYFFE